MTAPKANRLLIDAEEFKAQAAQRILSAKERVYVQAMTFECDEAGYWLLDLLKKSKAKERILSVDAYSLFNINDGWAFGWRYWTDKTYKAEVDVTRELLKSADQEGIRIHVTNRLGWRLDRFPARNHKKLLLVDKMAFIGGLNFSEHNFEWHDLMVTMDDPNLVTEVANDFLLTLTNINQSKIVVSGNDRVYFLDGRNSFDIYEQLFSEITSAARSIQIISPYVSNPLLDKLVCINDEVKIQIITPGTNNKSIMKDYLLSKTHELPWDILQYQGEMSHIKALLVDGNKLIIGSSNFDFVSYHLEQEIVWVTEDQQIISEFVTRVWELDKSKSISEKARKGNYFASRLVIFVLERLMKSLGWLQMEKR